MFSMGCGWPIGGLLAVGGDVVPVLAWHRRSCCPAALSASAFLAFAARMHAEAPPQAGQSRLCCALACSAAR
jgi:hypothetical protein